MDVEKATAGTHASQRVTANPEARPSQPKRLDLRIVVEVPLPEGITRRERESTRLRAYPLDTKNERHSASINSLDTLTYPNCKSRWFVGQ